MSEWKGTVDLRMTDISDSKFQQVDAKRLTFNEVNLAGTKINCANLEGLTLNDVNLTGAKITIDLSNVTITDCNITGLIINGIAIDELLSKHNVIIK
ncbi:pentapeptide repeat-containing protein [Cohnella sp.]|uniref:pentapeptide repeat-containing protein n=1 Tax=Cohnella sp. TaxID=1883426 RepID=UPI003563CD9E